MDELRITVDFAKHPPALFIKYIETTFGLSDVVPFINDTNGMFRGQDKETDDSFIVKVLTAREYLLTKYLLEESDAICSSYMALPMNILGNQELYPKTSGKSFKFNIMISPMYGISATADSLRGERVTSIPGFPDEFILDYKRFMLFRAAMGLYCIHQQGVIHADIKNDNYFGQNVLIADFGLSYSDDPRFKSIRVREENHFIVGNARKVIGHESLSPNLFVGPVTVPDYRLIDMSSDIWGFGLMALQWHVPESELPYETLFESYDDKNGVQTERKIKVYEFYRFFSDPGNKVMASIRKNVELNNLLTMIFSRQLVTMSDVIRHSYFSKLQKEREHGFDYQVGLMYVASSENASRSVNGGGSLGSGGGGGKSITARAPPGGPRGSAATVPRRGVGPPSIRPLSPIPVGTFKEQHSNRVAASVARKNIKTPPVSKVKNHGDVITGRGDDGRLFDYSGLNTAGAQKWAITSITPKGKK